MLRSARRCTGCVGHLCRQASHSRYVWRRSLPLPLILLQPQSCITRRAFYVCRFVHIPGVMSEEEMQQHVDPASTPAC